ncbi:hypothetical protein H6P81_017673 [Aristolochia fimbriata]|uniref:Uncharacterized protein n=1 Tax=Aristolochia fimbriata TaxID=158543 RepID=A0AAV7E0N8_ARIFI|nr:hypothetical protein H6P81_017673 [Aristolochia fimbriata]
MKISFQSYRLSSSIRHNKNALEGETQNQVEMDLLRLLFLAIALIVCVMKVVDAHEFPLGRAWPEAVLGESKRTADRSPPSPIASTPRRGNPPYRPCRKPCRSPGRRQPCCRGGN